MKFIHENGETIELIHPATFCLAERNGFKPIEKDELEELKVKAKEMGIKGYQLMGEEKLKEKIEEASK